MSDSTDKSGLPAQIADAIAGIPKALVPASVKALDRLIGAAVDIPVAWLAQQKSKIQSQTNAFIMVENAVANAAAVEAGTDEVTVGNAINVLVRKSYRRQANREAIAAATVEDLHKHGDAATQEAASPKQEIDEDWLNVFERYAEDASTERMQKLWGRVLAGEIRKPGRYSMRTLRFLSEFSQADGRLFAEFGKSAFGDAAPTSLVKPTGVADIRSLMVLELAGLIQGASGLGLTMNLTFDEKGHAYLREGDLMVQLSGAPGTKIGFRACALTPLGQELLSLLPGRDARAAARNVGNAIKEPAIKSALVIGVVGSFAATLEVLW